ncbi:hypothetical protein HYV44_03400 [Candidatus Microgenomates bacterium]|nr:hypothetical protein [Candidatus Microgenomates bacterium]
MQTDDLLKDINPNDPESETVAESQVHDAYRKGEIDDAAIDSLETVANLRVQAEELKQKEDLGKHIGNTSPAPLEDAPKDLIPEKVEIPPMPQEKPKAVLPEVSSEMKQEAKEVAKEGLPKEIEPINNKKI